MGQYQESAQQSSASLAMLREKQFRRGNILDSIQVEFQKPETVLLQMQSEYQLTSQRDSLFLAQSLNELDKALAILDRRKAILTTPEEQNIKIADNTGLLAFCEKLALDLYHKTGHKMYLNRLVGFHGSGIYNRSRLNAQKAMQFTHIPDSIRTLEQQIQQTIATTLTNNDLNGFIKANAKWQQFLEDVRTDFPRYFNLRYALLPEFSRQLTAPYQTTIIQYIFVDENLYAVVINGQSSKLIHINYKPVKDRFALLHRSSAREDQLLKLLHELHQQLWSLLKKNIQHQRVVIIPDAELFNLSFEMLVTSPIERFEDLPTHTLLADYAILYNHSLHLLEIVPEKIFSPLRQVLTTG